MSKKDIIDYVMETPGNTNKKVLGRLIDEIEGVKLPEVTEDDNGSVLTVVEGAWDKAEPSGGSTDSLKTITVGAIWEESLSNYRFVLKDSDAVVEALQNMSIEEASQLKVKLVGGYGSPLVPIDECFTYATHINSVKFPDGFDVTDKFYIDETSFSNIPFLKPDVDENEFGALLSEHGITWDDIIFDLDSSVYYLQITSPYGVFYPNQGAPKKYVLYINACDDLSEDIAAGSITYNEYIYNDRVYTLPFNSSTGSIPVLHDAWDYIGRVIIEYPSYGNYALILGYKLGVGFYVFTNGEIKVFTINSDTGAFAPVQS